MSVTLNYFAAYGKGEVIRMILHSQAIEFTDVLFDWESGLAYIATGKTEFGQMPCLEIDGKSLVESRAIERYLLTKAEVHTESPYEGYLNDSTISFLDDLKSIVTRFVFFDKDMEGFAKWWGK